MKKLGFSLLLALLMVGLFATAAAAQEYDPYNWNQELIDDQGNKFVYEDGVKYVIDEVNGKWVYHEWDEGTETWVATDREIALITNANDTTAGGSAYNNTDNFENVIKSTDMTFNDGSEGTQKTHTAYQNNTNSCASCHQTHTAQSKSLLFADSVYQTCAACHDGTLGFYNVFQNGEEYFASETTAGTFGGTHSGNMSVHLVNGAMQIKAAPGGFNGATDEVKRGGNWTSEFTCASCHAPHGSYSDRLLHYNPNNMGNAAPEDGGIKAEMTIVIDTWDNTATPAKPTYDLATDGEITTEYVLVKGTKTQHALTDAKYDIVPTDAVVAMLYKVAEVKNYEKVLTGYTFTKDTTPWLYGYSARGSDNYSHAYYSRLFKTDTPALEGGKALKTEVIDYGTTGANFKFDKALVYSTAGALDGAVRADIGRAYKVKMKLDPVYDSTNALYDIVKKNDISRLIQRNGADAKAMAEFCVSCHTDYLAKSGSETGTFDTAYRHTTDNGSYSCLLCHYAHGTDVEIMLDGQSRTVFDLEAGDFDQVQARAYMLDNNPSSALKKFTNMSGCWACHNSSAAETLRNTNREDGHPTSYITDPSQVDPTRWQTTEGE